MAESRLNIVIDAENRAKRAMKSARGDIQSFQSKIQSMKPTFRRMAIGGAAAFGGIAFGVKRATDAAADAEGAWNKFNTVFADGADEMREFVEDLRDEMPSATHEIARMAADLQDLLVPMGIARDEAQGMSQRFLDLSNKVAAFNDVDPSEVLEAMRSGIAGMSRPLRRFGIDARVTTLEAKALEEGLIDAGQSFADLEPDVKTQVRLQALLEQAYDQSADAIDGFADNQDSFLRRSQELSATLTDLKTSIGMAVMPALDDMLKRILPIIDSIQEWTKNNPQLVRTIISVSAAVAALTAVAGVLGLLLATISTTAVVLTGGLVALAGVGLLIARNWDTFKASVESVWKSLKNNFVVRGLIGLLRELWLTVQEQLLPALRKFWQHHGEKMKFILKALMAAVGALAGAFTATLVAALVGAIRIMTKAINIMNAFAGFIENKVIPAIRKLGRWINDNIVNPIETAIRKVERFIDLMQELGAGFVGGAVSSVQDILGFDQGGVVPGPIGSPQLAMVHGGETILPTHKRGASAGTNVNVSISNSTFMGTDSTDVAEMIGDNIIRRIKDNRRGLDTNNR